MEPIKRHLFISLETSEVRDPVAADRERIAREFARLCPGVAEERAGESPPPEADGPPDFDGWRRRLGVAIGLSTDASWAELDAAIRAMASKLKEATKESERLKRPPEIEAAHQFAHYLSGWTGAGGIVGEQAPDGSFLLLGKQEHGIAVVRPLTPADAAHGIDGGAGQKLIVSPLDEARETDHEAFQYAVDAVAAAFSIWAKKTAYEAFLEFELEDND